MNNSLINKENQSIILSRLSDLKFEIPPVQRGLVWNPKQVMDLWDSLSKGYPIGSFIAYSEGDTLELLDGQQRYNAIRMGIEINPQAILWVREKYKDKPIFMVCTTCHPWGFYQDGRVFESSNQAKANDIFLRNAGREKKVFADYFLKAELSGGYPWLFEGEGFVPVPFLMEGDIDKAWSSWKSCIEGNNLSRYQDFDESRKIFNRLHESTWLENIKEITVPVILWKKDKQANVDELFTRINKGGTQLSSVDERYSAICVYTGADLKKINDELAENFLPPERLITLAARVAYTSIEGKWILDISVDTIRKWFRADEERGEIGYADCLENIYDKGHLKKTIESFKSLCEQGGEKKHRIPSSIYLSTRDSWLWNMIWVLYYFELDDKNEDTKKYFPLFCMLPYILVSSTSKAALDEFCRCFYEGIKKLDTNTPLLTIMAVGCANAALFPKCCIYPYPTDSSTLRYAAEGWNRYEKLWQECFTKYQGSCSNPILYYYQRFYMNHLLDGSRFNPGMRSHWINSYNRPWDMDHIIPRKWWTNIKNRIIRNSVSNMQVLDFQHNRRKSDNSVFISLDYKKSEFDDDWSKCLRDKEDGMDRNCIDERNFQDKEESLFKRFDYIIRSCMTELHLMDLINQINRQKTLDSEQQEKLPDTLKNAIKRYNLMKNVALELREKRQDVCWGAVKFKWRQQSKNMDALMVIRLEEPDFYSSLTSDLSVGIPQGNQLLIAALSCDSYFNLEIGLRRGFEVSLEEWRNKYKDNQDAWWFRDIERPSGGDERQASYIASRILDLWQGIQSSKEK